MRATHDETVTPTAPDFKDRAELEEHGVDGNPPGAVPGQSVFVRGSERLVSSVRFLGQRRYLVTAASSQPQTRTDSVARTLQ